MREKVTITVVKDLKDPSVVSTKTEANKTILRIKIIMTDIMKIINMDTQGIPETLVTIEKEILIIT